MKKTLALILSALLILSACIIPVSAAEKDFMTDYFPDGLDTPQAPYIKEVSDIATGQDTDLKMYYYKTDDLQNLAYDIQRIGESDFLEMYGLTWLNVFIQVDTKFNDGEWLSTRGNWDETNEYGDIDYGENMQDWNLTYLLSEGNGYDNAEKLHDFTQSWLAYYDENEPVNDFLAPYVKSSVLADDIQYYFDFSELTISYRIRWCVKALIDQYTENERIIMEVSNWSDEVSIGKNGEQIEPTLPPELEAPVLSQFELVAREDGTQFDARCFAEIPDSIYQAILYHKVNDTPDWYYLDFQLKINDGDWIQGDTSNSTWLTNGFRDVFPYYTELELEEGDLVSVRLRFVNGNNETDATPWSNVVGTAPEIVEHQHDYYYNSNSTVHWQECDCGDKIHEAAHTFEDNICSVCGYDANNYCSHEGEKSYTYASKGYHTVTCLDCNAKLGEEACSGEEATCSQPCICDYCNQQYNDALEHLYFGHRSNETSHWQVCERCEFTTTEEAHVYGDDYFCDICLYDSTPKCAHDGTVTVRYNGDGTHSEKCTTCGETLGTGACSGGKATCTETGKCIVCKGIYLKALGHEYGATAVFDATHHWTKCTRCDVTKSKSAHIWVFDKEITPASFTATGVTRNKCTGCDATQNVEVKQFLYGDVDCDGYIRAADARLCLRQSVGLESFKEGTRQHIACNVDGDDAIRAADARLILRYSVGLETSFPVHN